LAELEELLENEETREQVLAYVREQGYKAPDEVEGLVKKKNELLEKLAKTKKAQLSESQRALLESIHEMGYESAEDLQEALSGNGEKVDRDLRKMQRQLEELQSKYDAERSARVTIEKDRAIDKAMDKAGIRPDARELVRAYFDKRAKVEESESGLAIFAQDDEGMSPPIDEYIDTWAKSEQGKNYVQKPVNVGAGVAGGGDVATKTVFTRQELSDPKIAKQVMERKKNGEDITVQ